MYEHCAYVLRALHAQADGEISKLFQTVMEGPIPHTPRGPLQLFLYNILSLGIERMQPWHRVRYRGREFSLQDTPLPESLHILREALRNTLLQQSSRERPAFEGIERADIGITTAIIRRKRGAGHISELTTLLAHGLWTRNRSYHAGQADTPLCPHCQVVEDTQHVFWDCQKMGGISCQDSPQSCPVRRPDPRFLPMWGVHDRL